MASPNPHFAFGLTQDLFDDTSFSAFQVIQQPAAQILLCGNIFLGLQGAICIRIPMANFVGAARGGILEDFIFPPRATMVAAGSWTAGGEIFINCILDSSPRGSADDGLGEASPFDSRNAWKPEDGWGPAWRRDFSGVFDHILEDTGGAPFVDTGVATGGSFAIRALVGIREELAQPFTVPAGPDWSVARARLRLRRFGTPIGSMEVAIQTSQFDNTGVHLEPDGSDLGVSAAVLNSVAPLSPGIGLVDYAFTPDVVLPPGNYWSVLRPSVPYPISLLNFIVWGQRRVFFGVGGSHRTLLSSRFNHGLYPGHADLFRDLTFPGTPAGADIVWNPEAAVVGQFLSTPDLTPLVQEVMLNSGHETFHALCFTFRTVGETRTYRFASNEHATLDPPGFGAQFRRRDIRVTVI